MICGHYEKIEETELKEKSYVGSNEQTQAYVAMTKKGEVWEILSSEKNEEYGKGSMLRMSRIWAL